MTKHIFVWKEFRYVHAVGQHGIQRLHSSDEGHSYRIAIAVGAAAWLNAITAQAVPALDIH